MKRIIIVIAFAALPMLLSAQDFVDGLISKYQGQKGFTTVVVHKAMFDLVAAIDDDNELDKLKNMVDNIRIIAMDENMDSDINFYNEMKSQINSKDYVELMTVKEANNDVVFYVQYVGKDIAELLLVAGGDDDNAVISIKGKIKLKELASLSKSVHVTGFEYLDKLESN